MLKRTGWIGRKFNITRCGSWLTNLRSTGDEGSMMKNRNKRSNNSTELIPANLLEYLPTAERL
jgi:hypothetical protein